MGLAGGCADDDRQRAKLGISTDLFDDPKPEIGLLGALEIHDQRLRPAPLERYALRTLVDGFATGS